MDWTKYPSRGCWWDTACTWPNSRDTRAKVGGWPTTGSPSLQGSVEGLRPPSCCSIHSSSKSHSLQTTPQRFCGPCHGTSATTAQEHSCSTPVTYGWSEPYCKPVRTCSKSKPSAPGSTMVSSSTPACTWRPSSWVHWEDVEESCSAISSRRSTQGARQALYPQSSAFRLTLADLPSCLPSSITCLCTCIQPGTVERCKLQSFYFSLSKGHWRTSRAVRSEIPPKFLQKSSIGSLRFQKERKVPPVGRIPKAATRKLGRRNASEDQNSNVDSQAVPFLLRMLKAPCFAALPLLPAG
mmetsp:Transcript_5580/g.34634  ORF Transcript_5580/g.34634 Transcript_5580/m.34634 type:complete len:296 (+) Transcript_5580:100-987(+)